MEITFPDSGRKVVLEGVSNSTLSLLQAKFEKNFGNKPEFALQDPLEEVADGDTSSAEFKQRRNEYLEQKAVHDEQLAKWQGDVRSIRWAAAKLYYAMAVQQPDIDAVNKEIEKNRLLVDLPQAIIEGFVELGIPEARTIFADPQMMQNYIYLWHVCITNTGEQSLFTNSTNFGSQQTREAVAEALFRIRSQIQG